MPRTKALHTGPVAIQRNMGRDFRFGNPLGVENVKFLLIPAVIASFPTQVDQLPRDRPVVRARLLPVRDDVNLHADGQVVVRRAARNEIHRQAPALEIGRIGVRNGRAGIDDQRRARRHRPGRQGFAKEHRRVRPRASHPDRPNRDGPGRSATARPL